MIATSGEKTLGDELRLKWPEFGGLKTVRVAVFQMQNGLSKFMYVQQNITFTDYTFYNNVFTGYNDRRNLLASFLSNSSTSIIQFVCILHVNNISTNKRKL
jgi:hypothetical protein